MHAFAEKPESVSWGAKPVCVRPKLKVSQAGDAHEREADEVSERVMRMGGTPSRRACPCGGGCPRCGARGAGRASLQTKRAPSGDAGQTPAPPVVHEVLASPGRPLDARARNFFEPRFGRDFGDVRVHTDERASESARALGALAYTVGSRIVFGAGEYAPETDAGRRLLAHELSHVEQQRDASGSHGDGAAVVQRACKRPAGGGNAIFSTDEADYIAAVRQGKYCRDTGFTGVFHGGRCYREVPPSRRGFPPADQVCFDPATGACTEDSPDVVSAVEGQNADGSCNLGIFFRSFGHFAEDIFPSEPTAIGTGFGLFAGSALGFAHEQDWKGVAVGAATGAVAGLTLGSWARPVGKWMGRRGYVPTIGTSVGTANPFPNLTGDATWQARLYVGASQRERPLFKIFYPEFRFGVALIGEAVSPGGGKVDPSAVTSLAAGLRIDPDEPGGPYVSFFGGPAVSIAGGDIGVGKEAVVVFGTRWRWASFTAQAGFLSDPTREAGADKQLHFGIGVELGPSRP